jgi:hypothetical protein
MNILIKQSKSDNEAKKEFKNWSEKVLENAYVILKHSLGVEVCLLYYLCVCFCLFILFVYFICLFVCLFVWLFVCLFVCSFIYFIYLRIYFKFIIYLFILDSIIDFETRTFGW